MDLNLARLNHILIPATKAERDRLRHGRLGKVLAVFGFFFESLTAEGRVVAFLVLVSSVAGLDVEATRAYVLVCLLASLFSASLVATRAYRLRGVRLEVAVPERVTVGEEVTFSLSLHSDAERPYHALRIDGPFLPWDGRWTGPAPAVATLPPRGHARVFARARFSARGEHHLDPFLVGALVPLGLARGRVLRSPGCRFVVVPKIANLTRLATPVGRRHQPGGVALASRTGESMDLLGVRPYRPGDSVRDLHARSWARTGVPVVREYQQEYFSRIGVVLDTDRAVTDTRRLEAAISLAAGVVARLSRGEALIDLLVVGHTVHDLTLGRNMGFLDQALDLLACVQPGPPLDPERLSAHLAPHLPRLSCVFFVTTAWDEPRARLVDRLGSLGAGCRTLVVVPEQGPQGRGSVSGDEARKLVPVDALERGEPLVL